MPQTTRSIQVTEEMVGLDLIVFKASEIVETGIQSIEIQASQVFNRRFTPAGGTAKWFRDELDQLWVKFTTAPDAHQDEVLQHVIPASRVVEVTYLKS